MTDISVYKLMVNDKNSLLAAYMPFVKNGGVFLKGAAGEPGSDVALLLGIPNEHHIYSMLCKVVWTTQRNQMSEGGIGVQFPENNESTQLKNKIDTLLGGTDRTKSPTMTA